MGKDRQDHRQDQGLECKPFVHESGSHLGCQKLGWGLRLEVPGSHLGWESWVSGVLGSRRSGGRRGLGSPVWDLVSPWIVVRTRVTRTLLYCDSGTAGKNCPSTAFCATELVFRCDIGFEGLARDLYIALSIHPSLYASLPISDCVLATQI